MAVNNAGTANAVSRNASAMTSSYVALNAFFRTPKVMPTNVYLEIALTTAVTNTATDTQFCRLCDRFFNLRESSLRIPSVGGAAETVPDSLIA